MYLSQFKLSKLAAGIGSVLWFMAYAPQLQAQPRQIAPMIPLATTWPAYGRIVAQDFSALEARVQAWRDAHPEIAETWHRERCRACGGKGVVRCGFDDLTDCPNCSNGPTDPTDFAADGVTVEPDRFCVTEANGGCVSDDPRCMHNGELPAGFAYADGKVVDLRAKPKRVRVRAKPLTAADIVIGGEYVPKRGNNKTPNLFVRDVQTHHAKCKEPTTVVHYVQKGKAHVDTMADFLALAARRVNA